MESLGYRSVLGFVVALAIAASGCGSSGAKPTQRCIRDSECTGNLICAQGYCVAKCEASKDCHPVARCIKVPEGAICEAPETVTCHYNSDCPRPLVCSGDLQCRSQCKTGGDCPTGQFCTTTSKLCADPAVDKSYDPAANEFKDATAAFGAGIEKPDGGDGGGGMSGAAGDGGAAAGTDGGAAGTDGDAMDVPAGQPEVGIAASCPGTPLTLFGKLATSDSNPGYTSGVGARLPNEMVIFSGFTGYDDVVDGGAADAGTDAAAVGPYVNRIDLQRFDLTGKAKGPAQRLGIVEGKADTRSSETVSVIDVTAAPTGEVALLYAAGNADGLGLYLKLLAPDTLAVSQTIQLQSVGGSRYGHQAHVQWEAGQFVASWVSHVVAGDTSYLNLAKFLKDGTPSGSTSPVPTAAIDSRTRNVDYEQATAAYGNGVFAVAHESEGDIPSLTFVGADGNQVGKTIALPYKTNTPEFTVVGATTKGFVAIYNGQITQDPDGGAPTAFATLATFVAPPNAVDGGAAGVGTTYAFPGVPTFNSQNGARASSDPLGAGFVLLTGDGKAAFTYFQDDGTKHLGPSQVIQQSGGTGPSDQVHLMNLNGSYGLSLYSRAERLTRMAASGCPATAP